MRLDLILTMRDIYINSNLNQLIKFTSSSRSTELKDIISWNNSQMITKTIAVSRRIVIRYAVKWGIPFEFESKWTLRKQHDPYFPMEGKPLLNKY